MGVEAKVPFRIAKESIKLAKGGSGTLITPSKTPVLKVDLLELTSLKSRPEAIDAAPINVSSTFIPSTPNLVEIAKGEPPNPTRWLMRDELRKEVIFST
jgi:hypothetical protein